MIQINFPPDPSKLVFLLSPSVPATYLLARAVQHYGADNLIVFDITHINHPDARIDVSRMRATARIADALGLTRVRYPTIDHNEKLNASNPVEKAAARVNMKNTALAAIRQYSAGVGEHIDQMPSHTIMTLYGIITAFVGSSDSPPGLRDASGNIIDPTGTQLAWYVTRPDDEYADLAATRYHKDVISAAWAPLADYHIADIVKSAHEEGILDTLSLVPHCRVDAVEPCGTCDGCLQWKMQLIKAEVI